MVKEASWSRFKILRQERKMMTFSTFIAISWTMLFLVGHHRIIELIYFLAGGGG